MISEEKVNLYEKPLLLHMSDFAALISYIFFQLRLPERESSEASFGGAASNEPGDKLPSKSTQQSQDNLPSKSTQSTQDKKESGWPVFYDGEKLLLTEFKDDLWISVISGLSRSDNI